MNRTAALAGTAVIVLNAIVTMAHGQAHTDLNVTLNAAQSAFVYTVILAAPLLALILLWTPRVSLAGLVLALAMAGSLAFSGFFHYIHISPDHVQHLPAGDAQGAFRLTAAAMVLTNLLGLAAGFVIWRRGAGGRPLNARHAGA